MKENDIDEEDQSSGEDESESEDVKDGEMFEKTVKSTEVEEENRKPSIEHVEDTKLMKEKNMNKEQANEHVDATVLENELENKETSIEHVEITEVGNGNKQRPETFKRDKKSKGFWDRAVDTIVITNFLVDAIGKKIEKGF